MINSNQEMEQEQSNINGSAWFKRFMREAKKVSPHLRFIRIKMGFWRIYWKDHYLHEVSERMPEQGYDWEDYDPRLESQQYYEDYEDNVELIKTIKNYIEGYRDSIDKIRTRAWMLLHDKEFHERSERAYRKMELK